MPKSRFTLDDIEGAYFSRKPPSFASVQPRRTGRKAEGIRFERRVQEYLCERSDLYLPSPWIIFITRDGRPNWCQPDGLNLDYRTGTATIVEIKLSHTPDSQRQLRSLYEPVIRRLFPRPSWGVRLVEFVKWFDPDTRYPEPFELIDDPLAHDSTKIGVHIWRP